MPDSLPSIIPLKPPPELATFFEDPPLLANERRSDYDAFVLAVAMADPPTNAIDWILSYDYAARRWELRRERRVKAEIIKFHQQKVVEELLKSTFDRSDRLGSAQNRIFNAAREAQAWASDVRKRRKIDSMLEQKGHSPASVLAQAYIRGARDIDLIERRIATYEQRCSAILKEIRLRSAQRAQKLQDAAPPVIDGEFSEAAE